MNFIIQFQNIILLGQYDLAGSFFQGPVDPKVSPSNGILGED